MRIHAFGGTRFADASRAGSLAGPPYDQIDEVLRAELQQEPHHFAHLIRPGVEVDPHGFAARLHASWLETGVLTIDDEPALYPYEILFPDEQRRLGLATLVELEDPSTGIIRPHEATVAKTVDERLSLLRETQIDLEPILLLADDAGRLDELLTDDLRDSQALVDHQDSTGHRHRLYRITAVERIAEYQHLLTPCVGLIADGHHRYTVAQRYAQERKARSGTAAAAKLSVITSLTAPGLAIDPIHRQLRLALDIESVAGLASSHQSISSNSGQAIAEAVAGAPQPALAVSVGTRTELWGFAANRAPESLSPCLHHLAVGWLHSVLLPALGLPPEAATDGTVAYRSDPDRLLSELSSGEAAFGFWLPPMSGGDFAQAMQGGQLLPPKSTRFLPKVASGLVWARHDCALF